MGNQTHHLGTTRIWCWQLSYVRVGCPRHPGLMLMLITTIIFPASTGNRTQATYMNGLCLNPPDHTVSPLYFFCTYITRCDTLTWPDVPYKHSYMARLSNTCLHGQMCHTYMARCITHTFLHGQMCHTYMARLSHTCLHGQMCHTYMARLPHIHSYMSRCATLDVLICVYRYIMHVRLYMQYTFYTCNILHMQNRCVLHIYITGISDTVIV